MKRVLLVVLLILPAGCELERRSRADFERHNLSMLELSRTDDSVLVFEAKTGITYPESSQEAEATRMEWLQAWLDREGYCAQGYEIISRRRLGAGDINFHDMDLRYTLRCKEAGRTEDGSGPRG